MNDMTTNMFPALPEPTHQVFGLVTTQGTAMAETAYCVDHVSDTNPQEDIHLTLTHSEEVDTAVGLIDVSSNEAMFCQWCGFNGFRETYSDYEDDPFENE